MGRLKPGATYIYERANGVVYARESGSLDREAIGWEYDPATGSRVEDIARAGQEWREILAFAKSNPALQEAIDRVKLLYHLSKKEDGKE
jgi:hypothetical protein